MRTVQHKQETQHTGLSQVQKCHWFQIEKYQSIDDHHCNYSILKHLTMSSNWSSWPSKVFKKYSPNEPLWYWPINNHKTKREPRHQFHGYCANIANSGGGIFMYQLAKWSHGHPKPLQERQIELLCKKKKILGILSITSIPTTVVKNVSHMT